MKIEREREREIEIEKEIERASERERESTLYVRRKLYRLIYQTHYLSVSIELVAFIITCLQ